MSEIFKEYNTDFPFGPAAGAINGNNREEVEIKIKDSLRSPAPITPYGSITWYGGVGNAPEYGGVYYHNQATGQTVNSMGLPNIGIKDAEVMHPELQIIADAEGKMLVPSMSPGKGEDPTEVLPDMAYRFVKAGAKIIEINYSCPNKIVEGGGREAVLGNDLETMFEIDDKVIVSVGEDVIVIRKLPPYVGDKKVLIPDVAKGFSKVKGKVVLGLSNTVGGQQILTELGDPALRVPGNLGGLSGPATVEIGRNQLRQFRELLPKRIGIISCLGVTTGYEVHRRVSEMGADLAAGVTVFIENETHRGMTYGQTAQEIAEQYAQIIAQA